jgi:hypothetical protein
MITGFNTNVRYSGRVYHVQTEDSGRNNPHVISHLYHSGVILASEKREYGDLLGSEQLTGVVRRLMEGQHKAMLERLRRGEFDDLIAERLEDPNASTGSAVVSDPLSESQATEPSEQLTAEAVEEDERAFGEGIVSEKPLDEVILEYLVEKARHRAADGGARPGRGSRSRG